MDADAAGIVRDFYASGAVEMRGPSRSAKLRALAAAAVGAAVMLSGPGVEAAQPLADPPPEQRLAVAAQIVPGRSVAATYVNDARGKPLGIARQMERFGGAFAGLSAEPGIEQAERRVRADAERMGGSAVLIPTGGELACYTAVQRYPDPAAAMDVITGIATGTPERRAALRRRGYANPLGTETQARMVGRHEFEGHCLDAGFSPRSAPAADRQDNHRAEVHADTAMALTWMRDAAREGGAARFHQAADEVRAFADQRALTPFELNARYAYSRADGATYHTGPGMLAAIAFAQQHAALAPSDPRHLASLSDRDLHREIDRIAGAHTMDAARLERMGREVAQILNRPGRHLGDDGAPALAALPLDQVAALSPDTIEAVRAANGAYGRLLGPDPAARAQVAADSPAAFQDALARGARPALPVATGSFGGKYAAAVSRLDDAVLRVAHQHYAEAAGGPPELADGREIARRVIAGELQRRHPGMAGDLSSARRPLLSPAALRLPAELRQGAAHPAAVAVSAPAPRGRNAPER